jgi:hypothetical protein
MTATGSQSTPNPILGPHPPDLVDLWQAQLAPLQADLSDADFERLVAERQQTEAAFLAAYDRHLVRELEVADVEPEAEANLWTGPGWDTPLETDPEAEAEWAGEWDSADSAAYQARVEAGLEPEAEL